jgi:hypothetical protein
VILASTLQNGYSVIGTPGGVRLGKALSQMPLRRRLTHLGNFVDFLAALG